VAKTIKLLPSSTGRSALNLPLSTGHPQVQIWIHICVSIGYTPRMTAKDSGLRIRVEKELRQEFLRACRANDIPAAQVLRAFMREYIASQVEKFDRRDRGTGRRRAPHDL
jgi:hypothetical protein